MDGPRVSEIQLEIEAVTQVSSPAQDAYIALSLPVDTNAILTWAK